MLNQPLICSGSLTRDCLAGRVAIVTGAGDGIGFEAARALAWLGAKVVLAEISPAGKNAAEKINGELGPGTALFIKTDVGSERSVNRMGRKVFQAFGRVDIVLNNATFAPLGAVRALPVKLWDASYRVNLRGPVLLAQKFIPGMVRQNSGVFVCVSSEGLAYMGAYETLKAAQLHLARTIDAELEGTDVISFTIGPGMVPTATALRGLKELAGLYGKTVGELVDLVKEHTISIEAAGAGFAASIALAPQFRGQDIGAKQALHLANIDFDDNESTALVLDLSGEEIEQALLLCREVLTTLKEQAEGWQQRSVFERQWVIRDFKKNAGMPLEQWLDGLGKLERALIDGDLDAVTQLNLSLEKLVDYYEHLQELSRGYIKDPQKLAESLQHVSGWQTTANKLLQCIKQ